ncbi:MAG: glycosyltransferase [Myxococcota bacterium]
MMKISLCMIVRDEIEMLPGCLESIAGAVDEAVIVDTGSTDGTDAWAKARADVFVRFPWCDDFSAARNAAIEQATGDWILIVDADERLVTGREALRRACDDASSVAWRIQVRDSSGSVWLTRLFRRRDDVRFRGRIHEQVTEDLQALGVPVEPLSGVTLEHHGYEPERFSARGKRERNVRLLRRELEDQPDDPYLHYKLYQASGGDSAALERAADLTLALEEFAFRRFALSDEILCAAAGHWLSKGLTSKAEAACERAMAAFGEHPALLTHLGTARNQRGDLAGAIQRFRRAWHLDPESGRFAVDVRAMRIHLAREYARALIANGDHHVAADVVRSLGQQLTSGRVAPAA